MKVEDCFKFSTLEPFNDAERLLVKEGSEIVFQVLEQIITSSTNGDENNIPRPQTVILMTYMALVTLLACGKNSLLPEAKDLLHETVKKIEEAAFEFKGEKPNLKVVN